MHNKSDALSNFQHFKTLVENCFSNCIKVFHCDGSGEFTNNAFTSFLRANIIHLQLSCPYTPQKNGVAKKNRHITKLACTICLHANLLPTFWVDATLIAIFTINCLPSATLNYKCPFELLHHTPLDYNYLWTFRCLCYPNTTPQAPNKISPCSLPWLSHST